MSFQDETIWAGRLATLSASVSCDETFHIGACVVNGRTGLIEAPGGTARLRPHGTCLADLSLPAWCRSGEPRAIAA